MNRDNTIALRWGAKFVTSSLPFYGRLTIKSITPISWGGAEILSAVCVTNSGKKKILSAHSVRKACDKVFPVLDWEDLVGRRVIVTRRGESTILKAIP